MNNERSRWILQKNDLPQGIVLSPTIFNIYTNNQPIHYGTRSFHILRRHAQHSPLPHLIKSKRHYRGGPGCISKPLQHKQSAWKSMVNSLLAGTRYMTLRRRANSRRNGIPLHLGCPLWSSPPQLAVTNTHHVDVFIIRSKSFPWPQEGQNYSH